MRRGTALLALAFAMLALAAGCQGDNASGETSGGGAFLAMLRLVPDEPEYRAGVHIGDMGRAFKLADIDRTREALEQYLMGRASGEVTATVSIPMPRSGMGLLELRREAFLSEYDRLQEYFGIGFHEVDQWLETGLPPSQLFAIGGHFQPEQVDEQLAACDECPEADRREAAGVSYYAWGDDFAMSIEDPFKPPAFDRFGRGGRIAVLETYALRAVWDEGIESMLGALDAAPSLADDKDFQLLAAGLEDLGALGATLTDQTTGPELAEQALSIGVYQGQPDLHAAAKRAWSATEGPPVLEPYVAIAAGPAHDGDEAYTAVVIVHEDEEAARANAERLGPRIDFVAGQFTSAAPQPLFEPFERVETEVDGRVLKARLYGRASWLPLTPLPTVPLFLHE